MSCEERSGRVCRGGWEDKSSVMGRTKCKGVLSWLGGTRNVAFRAKWKGV